ncbi:MAG: hypothetical protein WAK93_19565 [Solirubrobacteraceae bacterium]
MNTALRVLSAILALVAVGCMALAIVGMVTGRPSDRAGYFIRLLAVVCFAGAVVLNVIAH